MVAVEEAFGAPDAMEGVVHLMHGVLWAMVVGTSATNKVVIIFCVRASTGNDGDSHD